MKRVLIWDIPTRLIHWMLSAGILLAFAIAQFGGEDSKWFDYHAIIGVAIVALMVMRVVWGVVGTRHARFGSFVMSPLRLAGYMASVFKGKPVAYAGHNPATSWAAPVMYGLVVVIVVTGLMLGLGYEVAEEFHALSVYVLLGVIATHVLGVIVHSVQAKEQIVVSMIDGQKRAEEASAIRSSRPLVGAAVLVLMSWFTTSLVINYDRGGRHTHLPLLGTTIGLGEGEGGEGNQGTGAAGKDDDD